MAYIVNTNQKNLPYNVSEDFNYTYPDGLNLKPGSEMHEKLKNLILEKARLSHESISKRFPSWREIDKVLTVYARPDFEEKKVQDLDDRKPVSIIFPYSFSMLETQLTYLCTAFFQDPIFRYEGVSPEDTLGAKLLELIIQLHCIRSKVALSMHTSFRDALAYGLGIGIPSWNVTYGKKVEKVSGYAVGEGFADRSGSINVVESVLFEGNELYNIDPYCYLPDPHVGVQDVQKGEFVGWIERESYLSLLRRESHDEDLFNVRYVKTLQNTESFISMDNSSREDRFKSVKPHDPGVTSKVDVIWMNIELIPKDYGLSDLEYPEKWYFALAADEILIKARPLGYYHNKFPIAIASPDYDGYSCTPMSRMEVMYGLQHTLDWLFNSHITNVRKSLNDMFVVDPYLVNILDVADPKPGKIIRLKRAAWGRGVEKAVQQLSVTDVTKQHISDSAYITSWMERVAAIDGSMMGALRQGGPERLTLGEFQGTRGAATSRLQRMAMVISQQFMFDIGYMFASHTQQLMSQDLYVNTVGRWDEDLSALFGESLVQGKMKATPFDLAIDYDVIPRDGSIPGGQMSEVWMELFKVISASPELSMQIDSFKVFAYIAQQLGAKNVEDFKRVTAGIGPTPMADDEVLREAERGNLVPLGR